MKCVAREGAGYITTKVCDVVGCMHMIDCRLSDTAWAPLHKDFVWEILIAKVTF